MNDSMTYVDVDGHILEPPNMWLDYIEPEYRDGAVQILLDDKGGEPGVPEAGDGRHHVLDDFWREALGRLVEQHQAGGAE